MRYLIFLNIKRWLIEYGVDLLDILLEPHLKSTEEMKPINRYDNFMHELNRHMSYDAFYKSNFYAHLPILQVYISDLGYSGNCYHQYMVQFKYHHTTISADQEDVPENTPERYLEIEDLIDCYLSNMMSSKTIGKLGVINRNLFQDLWAVENFDGKIKNVSSIEEYPLTYSSTEHEITTLHKQFLLTLGECAEW